MSWGKAPHVPRVWGEPPRGRFRKVPWKVLGRRSSTSPGTGCCFAPQLCLVLAGGPGQVLAPRRRGCLCCFFGDGRISLASPRGQHTHWTRPSVGRRLVPCSACRQSALGWFFLPAPTALTPFQMNLRPPGQTWGPATQAPVCTADKHNQLPPEMRTCAPLSPSSNPFLPQAPCFTADHSLLSPS